MDEDTYIMTAAAALDYAENAYDADAEAFGNIDEDVY